MTRKENMEIKYLNKIIRLIEEKNDAPEYLFKEIDYQKSIIEAYLAGKTIRFKMDSENEWSESNFNDIPDNNLYGYVGFDFDLYRFEIKEDKKHFSNNFKEFLYALAGMAIPFAAWIIFEVFVKGLPK